MSQADSENRNLQEKHFIKPDSSRSIARTRRKTIVSNRFLSKLSVQNIDQPLTCNEKSEQQNLDNNQNVLKMNVKKNLRELETTNNSVIVTDKSEQNDLFPYSDRTLKRSTTQINPKNFPTVNISRQKGHTSLDSHCTDQNNLCNQKNISQFVRNTYQELSFPDSQQNNLTVNQSYQNIGQFSELRKSLSQNQLIDAPVVPKMNDTEPEKLTKNKSYDHFKIRRYVTDVSNDDDFEEFYKEYLEKLREKSENTQVLPTKKSGVSFDKYYRDLRSNYVDYEHSNIRSKSGLKDLKIHPGIDINMMMHEYKIAKDIFTEACKAKSARNNTSKKKFNSFIKKVIPTEVTRQSSNYQSGTKFVTEECSQRVLDSHITDQNLKNNTNYGEKLKEFVEINKQQLNNQKLTIGKKTLHNMNIFSNRQIRSNNKVLNPINKI